MADNNYDLSRRKALLGLGTIGAAGAGAGMGTSALFTDEESFEDNTMVAGELNLLVDYWTSSNTNTTTSSSGQRDGDVSALLELTDIKPGDDGKVVFCPKIVDNPAYLWAGSGGLTQYENGYTEPEGGAEDMNATDESIEGRPLNGSVPEDEYPVADVDGGASAIGDPYGELADNIQVTVSYCEPSDDLDTDEEPSSPDDFQDIRVLDNPDDYTLADLILELQTGFPISNNADGTYPASADEDDQAGVCLCIDWEVPIEVGNEIQSDSVEFDIGFGAVQSRNVSDPAAENPYVDAMYTTQDGYGDTWDSGTVDTLSNLGADRSSEVLNISYGSQKVVFKIDLADSLDTGSSDNDVFNLVFDSNDDGTIDFEVAWAADPSNTAPAGENFWHKDISGSGGASSLSNFSDISADLDTANNTVTITIGRSRLGGNGSSYQVAWQALYRGGSSSFDATKIPDGQPRWKYGTGSSNFAEETVPNS